MDNDTCRQKYRLLDLDPAAKFSNDQIAYYCPLYAEYDNYERSMYVALGVIMAITGAVGLISNTLAFATFSVGAVFKKPSYLYHKAIALIELVHMAVMFQFGVLRALQFPGNSYWIVWWRDYAWGGWIIGNAAKMAVNCVIMFLSLERMMGVLCPLRFESANQSGVAIAAITTSILIGCLVLPAFAANRVVLRFGTDYDCELTAFGSSSAYAIIQSAINVIKLGLGGLTLVFSILVALGMYLSNKKAETTPSNANARWKEMKMACYLQLVLGVTTAVTHIVFVWYQVVQQQLPYPVVGRIAMLTLESFDQALENLSRSRYVRAVEMVNGIVTCVDHGERFFFYLMFNSTFRFTFIHSLWNRFRQPKVHPLNNDQNP